MYYTQKPKTIQAYHIYFDPADILYYKVPAWVREARENGVIRFSEKFGFRVNGEFCNWGDYIVKDGDRIYRCPKNVFEETFERAMGQENIL